MCVQVAAETRDHRIPWSIGCCVLETEHGAFGRAACTLNCSTVSLVLTLFFPLVFRDRVSLCSPGTLL